MDAAWPRLEYKQKQTFNAPYIDVRIRWPCATSRPSSYGKQRLGDYLQMWDWKSKNDYQSILLFHGISGCSFIAEDHIPKSTESWNDAVIENSTSKLSFAMLKVKTRLSNPNEVLMTLSNVNVADTVRSLHFDHTLPTTISSSDGPSSECTIRSFISGENPRGVLLEASSVFISFSNFYTSRYSFSANDIAVPPMTYLEQRTDTTSIPVFKRVSPSVKFFASSSSKCIRHVSIEALNLDDLVFVHINSMDYMRWIPAFSHWSGPLLRGMMANFSQADTMNFEIVTDHSISHNQHEGVWGGLEQPSAKKRTREANKSSMWKHSMRVPHSGGNHFTPIPAYSGNLTNVEEFNLVAYALRL
ncbi:hypothetical protein DEU56DRAFT_756840 [Suillus clintonianus]|uniref:uncharacterized protein n=1 Tax=Suillus clintonianus TaxID=1904413 RepID=UPI001B865258|nr:uncharacterized protein DEU56DRAFT_756840 [Suillus clintonianus]KAG2134812.1 hypothetical protein DEU56DRAFT_756840 [Suillus clintonianus]